MEPGQFNLSTSGAIVDLISAGKDVRNLNHIRVTNNGSIDTTVILRLQPADGSYTGATLLNAVLPGRVTVELTDGLRYNSEVLILQAQATPSLGPTTNISIILT